MVDKAKRLKEKADREVREQEEFFETACPCVVEKCQYAKDMRGTKDPLYKTLGGWTKCKFSRMYKCEHPEHPVEKHTKKHLSILKAVGEAFKQVDETVFQDKREVTLTCPVCGKETMKAVRFYYNDEVPRSSTYVDCETCLESIHMSS